MPCNEWIRSRVRGKTFADVGGLWGTDRERVTVAAQAGASRTAMIDITELDHELWHQFHARCEEQGVTCDASLQANIDDPGLASRVGRYDIVHCAGVIYHCPNPLHTVSQLASITGETLILGSVIIPPVIENTAAGLRVENNSALFVPSLSESQRTTVAQYFEEVGARIYGINMPLARGWSPDDYTPWWYLFTAGFIAGLVSVCGFKILDSVPEWHGRAAYFLAERIREHS
ncbi:MAG: hypothetical protein ACM3ON_01955 [Chloroflexota bacterium]|jgi:hypothetical protein